MNLICPFKTSSSKKSPFGSSSWTYAKVPDFGGYNENIFYGGRGN